MMDLFIFHQGGIKKDEKYSSIFPQFDNQEEVIEEPYKLVVKRINLYFKKLKCVDTGLKGCVLRLLEKENEN